MRRVLFSITSLAGGGAERVVSVWASQLAEKGYEVGIFTYARSENEYPVNPKVTRLTVAKTKKEYLSYGYLRRYRLARNAVKSFAPDVVISFLSNMQIWMMLTTVGLKLKRIDTVRISPWHNGSSKIVQAAWKHCFKTGDLTILQSEDQKAFFGKSVQKKCVVVPNPLNADYELEGKEIYNERALRFCAAGRLCTQKNFPLLISAFVRAHQNNPDITLDIYGKGTDEYTDKLHRLISENGADSYICLCGRTNDMRCELLKHDVFVMSSDFEGMPNALAEAMATGLVCISTDCRTGPRDLIEDGKTGFLVPVDDVDNMSNKILEVSQMSSSEVESIGKNARAFATEYCGRENSLARLIEAIEKC